MSDTNTSFIDYIDTSQVNACYAIFIAIKKIKFSDNGDLLYLGNHRTSILPDTDLDLQLGYVNNSLVSLGFQGLEEGDWQKVKNIALNAFTNEIISCYNNRTI